MKHEEITEEYKHPFVSFMFIEWKLKRYIKKRRTSGGDRIRVILVKPSFWNYLPNHIPYIWIKKDIFESWSFIV